MGVCGAGDEVRHDLCGVRRRDVCTARTARTVCLLQFCLQRMTWTELIEPSRSISSASRGSMGVLGAGGEVVSMGALGSKCMQSTLLSEDSTWPFSSVDRESST